MGVSFSKCIQVDAGFGILTDFPRKMFMPVIDLKAAYAMKQLPIEGFF